MPVTIECATDSDAAAVAAVRLAAARDLTARFGTGTWSFAMESDATVRGELRSATILIARETIAPARSPSPGVAAAAPTRTGTIVGTLRLATRSPWLSPAAGSAEPPVVDAFTPCDRPLYLTSMAVAPAHQRRGIGRQLLAAARRGAIEMRGQAIRLDSYDAPAGAGEFYHRCGFREVRRGEYNGTPLVFFELILE